MSEYINTSISVAKPYSRVLYPSRESPRWLLVATAISVPLLFPVIATFVAGMRGSLGLIPPFAVIQAGAFLVVVVGLIFGIGRMRPRDVGLRAHQLPVALLGTVLVWSSVQGLLVVRTLALDEGFRLDDSLVQSGAAVGIVGFLGNLIGTALFEETTYRGFLLPQLFQRFSRRAGSHPGRFALGAAVVSSAALFTLAHVPALFFQTRTAGEIAAIVGFTMVGGLYGAVLYLRTENLLLVMGLHALNNSPVPVFAAPDWLPSVLVLAAGLVLAALWPSLPLAGRSDGPRETRG